MSTYIISEKKLLTQERKFKQIRARLLFFIAISFILFILSLTQFIIIATIRANANVAAIEQESVEDDAKESIAPIFLSYSNPVVIEEGEMVPNEVDNANFEEIEIPESAGDGWFKSYMDPIKITYKGSKQYEQKSLYELQENGLYMCEGKYVVAMSEMHFDVGDEVVVTFDDGVVIECLIGDVKNHKDKNFNGLGHKHNVFVNGEYEEHSSIVEFFVSQDKLDKSVADSGNVNSIISNGNVIRIQKLIKEI